MLFRHQLSHHVRVCFSSLLFIPLLLLILSSARSVQAGTAFTEEGSASLAAEPASDGLLRHPSADVLFLFLDNGKMAVYKASTLQVINAGVSTGSSIAAGFCTVDAENDAVIAVGGYKKGYIARAVMMKASAPYSLLAGFSFPSSMGQGQGTAMDDNYYYFGSRTNAKIARVPRGSFQSNFKAEKVEYTTVSHSKNFAIIGGMAFSAGMIYVPLTIGFETGTARISTTAWSQDGGVVDFSSQFSENVNGRAVNVIDGVVVVTATAGYICWVPADSFTTASAKCKKHPTLTGTPISAWQRAYDGGSFSYIYNVDSGSADILVWLNDRKMFLSSGFNLRNTTAGGSGAACASDNCRCRNFDSDGKGTFFVLCSGFGTGRKLIRLLVEETMPPTTTEAAPAPPAPAILKSVQGTMAFVSSTSVPTDDSSRSSLLPFSQACVASGDNVVFTAALGQSSYQTGSYTKLPIVGFGGASQDSPPTFHSVDQVHGVQYNIARHKSTGNVYVSAHLARSERECCMYCSEISPTERVVKKKCKIAGFGSTGTGTNVAENLDVHQVVGDFVYLASRSWHIAEPFHVVRYPIPLDCLKMVNNFALPNTVANQGIREAWSSVLADGGTSIVFAVRQRTPATGTTATTPDSKSAMMVKIDTTQYAATSIPESAVKTMQLSTPNAHRCMSAVASPKSPNIAFFGCVDSLKSDGEAKIVKIDTDNDMAVLGVFVWNELSTLRRMDAPLSLVFDVAGSYLLGVFHREGNDLAAHSVLVKFSVAASAGGFQVVDQMNTTAAVGAYLHAACRKEGSDEILINEQSQEWKASRVSLLDFNWAALPTSTTTTTTMTTTTKSTTTAATRVTAPTTTVSADYGKLSAPSTGASFISLQGIISTVSGMCVDEKRGHVFVISDTRPTKLLVFNHDLSETLTQPGPQVADEGDELGRDCLYDPVGDFIVVAGDVSPGALYRWDADPASKFAYRGRVELPGNRHGKAKGLAANAAFTRYYVGTQSDSPARLSDIYAQGSAMLGTTNWKYRSSVSVSGETQASNCAALLVVGDPEVLYVLFARTPGRVAKLALTDWPDGSKFTLISLPADNDNSWRFVALDDALWISTSRSQGTLCKVSLAEFKVDGCKPGPTVDATFMANLITIPGFVYAIELLEDPNHIAVMNTAAFEWSSERFYTAPAGDTYVKAATRLGNTLFFATQPFSGKLKIHMLKIAGVAEWQPPTTSTSEGTTTSTTSASAETTSGAETTTSSTTPEGSSSSDSSSSSSKTDATSHAPEEISSSSSPSSSAASAKPTTTTSTGSSSSLQQESTSTGESQTTSTDAATETTATDGDDAKRSRSATIAEPPPAPPKNAPPGQGVFSGAAAMADAAAVVAPAVTLVAATVAASSSSAASSAAGAAATVANVRVPRGTATSAMMMKKMNALTSMSSQSCPLGDRTELPDLGVDSNLFGFAVLGGPLATWRGAILSCIVACLLMVALCCLATFMVYCFRKRKATAAEQEEEQEEDAISNESPQKKLIYGAMETTRFPSNCGTMFQIQAAAAATAVGGIIGFGDTSGATVGLVVLGLVLNVVFPVVAMMAICTRTSKEVDLEDQEVPKEPGLMRRLYWWLLMSKVEYSGSNRFAAMFSFCISDSYLPGPPVLFLATVDLMSAIVGSLISGVSSGCLAAGCCTGTAVAAVASSLAHTMVFVLVHIFTQGHRAYFHTIEIIVGGMGSLLSLLCSILILYARATGRGDDHGSLQGAEILGQIGQYIGMVALFVTCVLPVIQLLYDACVTVKETVISSSSDSSAVDAADNKQKQQKMKSRRNSAQPTVVNLRAVAADDDGDDYEDSGEQPLLLQHRRGRSSSSNHHQRTHGRNKDEAASGEEMTERLAATARLNSLAVPAEHGNLFSPPNVSGRRDRRGADRRDCADERRGRSSSPREVERGRRSAGRREEEEYRVATDRHRSRSGAAEAHRGRNIPHHDQHRTSSPSSSPRRYEDHHRSGSSSSSRNRDKNGNTNNDSYLYRSSSRGRDHSNRNNSRPSSPRDQNRSSPSSPLPSSPRHLVSPDTPPRPQRHMSQHEINQRREMRRAREAQARAEREAPRLQLQQQILEEHFSSLKPFAKGPK